MASNAMQANGNKEDTPSTEISDVKIIVVGDTQCGKTKFIEAFAEREGNRSGSHYSNQHARVYQCRYEIKEDSPTDVKIFKIIGGSQSLIDTATKDHSDANGIVFMYSIDNRSSFEAMPTKWFETLKSNGCWNCQRSILVGNKTDLRGNPQVIRRLAMDDQAPVTEEEGKNLAENYQITKFFECSSIDENDRYIHEAFDFILKQGLLDWRREASLNLV